MGPDILLYPGLHMAHSSVPECTHVEPTLGMPLTHVHCRGLHIWFKPSCVASSSSMPVQLMGAGVPGGAVHCSGMALQQYTSLACGLNVVNIETAGAGVSVGWCFMPKSVLVPCPLSGLEL